MDLAVSVLALALLGAGFTPAHLEPSLQHVRWTIRSGDLVATADVDDRIADRSIVNVPGPFPLTVRRPREESHQRVRIVVGGRLAFDRALTRDEARRLGALEALHIANDVRGARDRDLAATGTAMLQYHASPRGYRVVSAVVGPDLGRASRPTDCDRKGSFELERTASYAGETVRVVQRGTHWYCLRAAPDEGEITIASGGKTTYRTQAIWRRGEVTPPDAAGVLQITDGPTFVDFEGTGNSAIVLTGTTGGAHCCFRTHVFYRTAAHGYTEAARTWGNGFSYPVLVFDPRSGEILFGSSNDAFAWMFGGYGNALEPVQIFAFERGRFLDVTPGFPDVVNVQADRFLVAARRMQRDKNFSLAQVAFGAYLADMSILGRSAEGWRKVERLCTAPECAQVLGVVRARLREVNY